MVLTKIALLSLSGGEPIGLASIATYLEKKGNFKEIRIFDSQYNDLLNDTVRYDPEIIGISAFTVDYGRAIKLAEEFKKKTRAKIIVGSYHISTLPTSFKKVFDVGVIGEGEQTMLELMQLFEKTRNLKAGDLKKIPGIVFFDKKSRLAVTKKRENIKSMDDIPITDRKYINERYYAEGYDLAEWYPNAAAIETARGCPYNCVFCSPRAVWGKMRARSVDKVIEELKCINKNFGVSVFSISDDLFICNKSRIKELIEKLKKEGLLGKFIFMCYARANLMDDEICLLLREMNVRVLNFGFESGSERILKFLKGNTVTVEDNKKAVLLCKKYGFRVQGNILLASPGEKLKDMEESVAFIDFCIKQKIKGYISIFILTPFPGTLVWEIAKQRGKASDDMDWETLRFQNWENPLLLDEDVGYEEFRKIVAKTKKKLRYFHRQVWLDKLRRNPFTALKLLFSGGRLFKYFFIHKRTDI